MHRYNIFRVTHISILIVTIFSPVKQSCLLFLIYDGRECVICNAVGSSLRPRRGNEDVYVEGGRGLMQARPDGAAISRALVTSEPFSIVLGKAVRHPPRHLLFGTAFFISPLNIFSNTSVLVNGLQGRPPQSNSLIAESTSGFRVLQISLLSIID